MCPACRGCDPTCACAFYQGLHNNAHKGGLRLKEVFFAKVRALGGLCCSTRGTKWESGHSEGRGRGAHGNLGRSRIPRHAVSPLHYCMHQSCTLYTYAVARCCASGIAQMAHPSVQTFLQLAQRNHKFFDSGEYFSLKQVGGGAGEIR